MPKDRPAVDLELVRLVLTDATQAWAGFVQRVADTTWTACSIACCEEPEAREAFTAVFDALRADGFRCLRQYDGTGSINTFVALHAREFLAERLMRRISEGRHKEAWAAFEHFFRRDIDRILRRRMPGPEFDEIRRDAYQEICLALVADGFKRIKSYSGSGSFTGFILQAVDRLAIDHIRRTASRRKKSGVTGTADGPRSAMVSVPIDGATDIASGEGTAEDLMIEKENELTLEAAAQALREASCALTDAEQLYMRIALGSGEPLPAREVARLMGRPVEEIYKLKQRVMGRLRDALERNPAVKLWRASV
ncbi:RNA polymerase sigma factor [Magnetospirillum sp. UT-4]|uniref:RNA polymerase sigma factor n=1 Tax=Magnetospirillum sp. UT-4 TaxID=2681467 RepID=UPI0020C257BE|nr:sigma-70 family RNA polymerase sigma factor [Magnetospirillum sp. UT-4]